MRRLESLFRAVGRSVAVAVSLGIAGCASFKPQPGPGAEPPGDYIALTAPIIAENQRQKEEKAG